MKARMCPHGNRDSGKDSVRKDSATAQFDVIRLMMSIATLLSFYVGLIDIQGAYLQSGPIKRDILVLPPIEVGEKRGILWKLVKLPYSITEAGRQWATVIEEWLLHIAKMEQVHGASQLFLKKTAGAIS